MALAFVICLIALSIQLLGASLWAISLYVISAFVVLQALLKWHDSRWVMCKGCGSAYTHYGRG